MFCLDRTFPGNCCICWQSLHTLDSLNSASDVNSQREKDTVVETKTLNGLLPLQCYSHCRGQQNIHPQKRHQEAGTGNCILEDLWVAWTCPASSGWPESHLIGARETQNSKRYHTGQHDSFSYATTSLSSISLSPTITKWPLLFQWQNKSHSMIKSQLP